KTGIDGYGVPIRNDIFVNAMISRIYHCLHDESSSCGTSSTRRLSWDNIIQCLIPGLRCASPWAV
ncbi:MAG: hypothetical protein IKB16_06240, partial [Lentisphaeria bacterium]|nr:hypothetical protein [Lentisphaeria bacterium]